VSTRYHVSGVAPVSKHAREQGHAYNPYSLPSTQDTSASASGSGSIPHTASRNAYSRSRHGATPVAHTDLSSPTPEVEGTIPRQPERHTDAGPISTSTLGRSASGRLPPAYGEQLGSLDEARATSSRNIHERNLSDSDYAGQSSLDRPVRTTTTTSENDSVPSPQMAQVDPDSKFDTRPLVPVRRAV
jgi:hypothetical protein